LDISNNKYYWNQNNNHEYFEAMLHGRITKIIARIERYATKIEDFLFLKKYALIDLPFLFERFEEDGRCSII
jgi:hypothetical protein